ncbi:MAG TPA: DUF4388 domain-containing protein [Myxococcota bacterium]|nr:DUF4388 domain-containing protein [Myxococcota bacterium]
MADGDERDRRVPAGTATQRSFGGVAAREPVLVADVATFPLPDLLGLVHGASISGLLHFVHEDHAKAVYLHRGEVVFATSNQSIDRLGECLVRAGVLSIEQLRQAERSFSPPDRFGKALVEKGFLTPRELWHGVKYQVEEIVRSLFVYDAGRLHVWCGEHQPDNVVRLALPTPRLVAEGVQRREEIRKFVRLLHDPRVRVSAVPGGEANLAGSERALHAAAQGESRFEEVCRRAGLDDMTGARVLQLLRLVGAVRLVRSHDAGDYVDEGDLRVHDEETLRARIAAGVKLLAALAAPIVEAEGEGPLAERFARTLAETAHGCPELLGGLAPGPGATLDPEAITERALRLSGEAEGQVAAAFSQLAAYLEFELKNHPRVRDAAAVLASVAPLRASIAD